MGLHAFIHTAYITKLIGSAIAEKKFVPPQSVAFLILEIIVNIIFFVEIFIRACSQGKVMSYLPLAC